MLRASFLHLEYNVSESRNFGAPTDLTESVRK